MGGLYTYSGKKLKRGSINPKAEQILKEALGGGAANGGSPPSVEDAQLRVGGRFALEAAYCMQDEVISSPLDGDVGAVFGVGFPPFRGGPFRWMDHFGIQEFVDHCDRLRDAHGEHWEAPQLMRDMAKQGKKWHS